MSIVERRCGSLVPFAACIALIASPVLAQRRGGGPPAEPLQFRFMGPAVGNRIAAAAGVPGDPSTYYFYHHGHPSTAVHRIVGKKLYEELVARLSAAGAGQKH